MEEQVVVVVAHLLSTDACVTLHSLPHQRTRLAGAYV